MGDKGSPRDWGNSDSLGKVKLVFKRRLGTDWNDLCDALEVPLDTRARFPHGEQPGAIWEWLERRDGLAKLPGALARIGRQDLADEISRHILSDHPGGSDLCPVRRSRRGNRLITIASLLILATVVSAYFRVSDVTDSSSNSGGPTPAPTLPCGLVHQQVSESELTKTYEYTIRNCRNETVRRKLDIADFTDGDCHTIKAGASVSTRITIPIVASIRDIKPC